jgi:hypothetical protein
VTVVVDDDDDASLLFSALKSCARGFTKLPSMLTTESPNDERKEIFRDVTGVVCIVEDDDTESFFVGGSTVGNARSPKREVALKLMLLRQNKQLPSVV